MEKEPATKNSGEREAVFRQTAAAEQKAAADGKGKSHGKATGNEKQILGRRLCEYTSAAGKSTQAGTTKSGKRMWAGSTAMTGKAICETVGLQHETNSWGRGTPGQMRGTPNGRDIFRGSEDVFLIECGGCHFIPQGLQ